MNKLLIAFLFSILFYETSLICKESYYSVGSITCAPELQRSLDAIRKIPEAQALITAIQKEGPIRIIAKTTNLSQQFGAFWDPDNRYICIAFYPNIPEASVIRSLLFELHNASVNSKINHLNELAEQRRIEKEVYIQSMEHLEYINSLNAAEIARKGIQMGVLPADAQLPTYNSFEEHFQAQKMSGHSDCFAHNYDLILRESYYRR